MINFWRSGPLAAAWQVAIICDRCGTRVDEEGKPIRLTSSAPPLSLWWKVRQKAKDHGFSLAENVNDPDLCGGCAAEHGRPVNDAENL